MTQLFASGTKYWSFNFSISPSNECSGLISFRIDWFDLLAIQGTLNIKKKTKILPCGRPITSWQIHGETMETVRDFILGGSNITADGGAEELMLLNCGVGEVP